MSKARTEKHFSPEAVAQRYSVKQVFLKISQNSQEFRQSLFFNKVASTRPGPGTKPTTKLKKLAMF